MPKTQADSAEKVVKLSRAKRNESTKRRILDVATKIVGKYGYAEASVARITEAAGIAQGTFYNHFANRQELLDQLLPTIGVDMVQFVRERTRQGDATTREIDRFRAFFEYLRQVPEFLRILNEAEFFAPSAYHRHFDSITTAFTRMLQRARDAGEIRAFSDAELEAITHMFMGARSYVSRHYLHSRNGRAALPKHVISAYEKLITGGLFEAAAIDKTPKRRTMR